MSYLPPGRHQPPQAPEAPPLARLAVRSSDLSEQPYIALFCRIENPVTEFAAPGDDWIHCFPAFACSRSQAMGTLTQRPYRRDGISPFEISLKAMDLDTRKNRAVSSTVAYAVDVSSSGVLTSL